MNKDTAIELLLKRWPNAEALRGEFEELQHWLAGEFDKGPFNDFVQGNGIVVSRRLLQNAGLKKDPTVGLIVPGTVYKFNTEDFHENLIVLQGTLMAGIGEEDFMPLTKSRSIIAPAGSDLKLASNREVFYVCHYHPK